MSKCNQHLLCVFIAALCYLQFHQHLLHTEAQSTTVRPYKFGFTIDEQQHRYEKRDERGIVMGEFGFITADGIYHVTVYATDEQGRFRILAMKNYPYEAKPKTIEILMKPKAAPTTTTTTTTTAKPTLARQNFYNEACSGCFVTNGNNKPKNPGETAVKTGIRTLAKPLPNAGAESHKSNLPPNSATRPKSSAGSPTAANQPRPAAGNRATAPHTTKLVQKHKRPAKENNRPFSTPLYQTVQPSVQHKSTLTYDSTQTQSNFVTSQTKTSTLTTAATTPLGVLKSTGFRHHNLPHTATLPHIVATKTHKIIERPSYTQTPTTTVNTGITYPSSSSSYTTNTYKPETARNTGVSNTYTLLHNSNPPDTSNPSTGLSKTPTIQPNIMMDVIVNKVLPTVIGSKGVVAKPTTATSPSGRTPANSLIPTGKSGSTNPAYGKANSNPQYKPSGAASTAGDDGDLYRFKYILDYHGHTETGKRNGNKEGNYFAIGDDDIERTIEYVANENGYQPRIHWRKVNNPVSAKENTLKDYEFVWFTRN